MRWSSSAPISVACVLLRAGPTLALGQPADNSASERTKETETNRTIIPFLEGTDVFWTVQGGNDRDPRLDAGFLDHITGVHIGGTFNQTGFFRFAKPTPEPRP